MVLTEEVPLLGHMQEFKANMAGFDDVRPLDASEKAVIMPAVDRMCEKFGIQEMPRLYIGANRQSDKAVYIGGKNPALILSENLLRNAEEEQSVDGRQEYTEEQREWMVARAFAKQEHANKDAAATVAVGAVGLATFAGQIVSVFKGFQAAFKEDGWKNKLKGMGKAALAFVGLGAARYGVNEVAGRSHIHHVRADAETAAEHTSYDAGIEATTNAIMNAHSISSAGPSSGITRFDWADNLTARRHLDNLREAAEISREIREL